MGSGLSLPCEHPGNALSHHTIREILRSPAVAELIDFVSDYFGNRTKKERKRASHGRKGHGRHTWLEDSPSAGWTDSDRNVPLSQPEETRCSLREPRLVIYHPVFPTSDHRRGPTTGAVQFIMDLPYQTTAQAAKPIDAGTIWGLVHSTGVSFQSHPRSVGDEILGIIIQPQTAMMSRGLGSAMMITSTNHRHHLGDNDLGRTATAICRLKCHRIAVSLEVAAPNGDIEYRLEHGWADHHTVPPASLR